MAQPPARLPRPGGPTGANRARAWLPLAGIAAAVIGVVGGLAWLVIAGMGEDVEPARKTVQQVTLVRPPPPREAPPPPPPEPEEVDVPEPDEP
ncbi:MAG: hypothetical protein J0M16_09785, partial [Gammaproteobacteria bacterium]|nr:hypothetical protein [Gammaproteobacteria bacterium]